MLQCAVRLFSNSRWRQNVVKTKTRHWATCEYVTDVLTTFWRLLWPWWTDLGLRGIYMFYIMSRKETTTYLPQLCLVLLYCSRSCPRFSNRQELVSVYSLFFFSSKTSPCNPFLKAFTCLKQTRKQFQNRAHVEQNIEKQVSTSSIMCLYSNISSPHCKNAWSIHGYCDRLDGYM